MGIARSSASRIEIRLLALLLAFGGLAGCMDAEEAAARKTGGDPGRGRILLPRYGCPSCHSIPGVENATGLIGPPLDRLGSRPNLAGSLANTPQNLMRWIRDPQSIAPGTAMPFLGVTEQDGRDIAAYLYTLK